MSLQTAATVTVDDHQTGRSTAAERVLGLQLFVFISLKLFISSESILTTTTAVSSRQLIFRVSPILAAAVLFLLFPLLAKPVRIRFLLRSPTAYILGFACVAAFGGLVLGRYPAAFTLWKSFEFCVPLAAIAIAASKCRPEAVARVAFRALEALLIAVFLTSFVSPGSWTRLGVLYQLSNKMLQYPPNKLAIGAGLYLILVVGMPLKRKRLRLFFGAVMVAAALSRSVLGMLFVGGWYFFSDSQQDKLRARVLLSVLSGMVPLVFWRFVETVITKGGKVGSRNIDTLSGRTVKWEEALSAFTDWPYGWGINGAFRDRRVDALREQLGNVHSSAIEAFLAAGILGGALWLAFWMYPLWRSRAMEAQRMSYVVRGSVFILAVSLVDSGFVLHTINAIIAGLLVMSCAPFVEPSRGRSTATRTSQGFSSAVRATGRSA